MSLKRPAPDSMSPERYKKLQDNRTKRRLYGQAAMVLIDTHGPSDEWPEIPDHLLKDLSVGNKDAALLRLEGKMASITIRYTDKEKAISVIPLFEERTKGRTASIIDEPSKVASEGDPKGALRGTLMVYDDTAPNREMLQLFIDQVAIIVDTPLKPLYSIGGSYNPDSQLLP